MILIVGCAGFIGKHLSRRLLCDGYEVGGILLEADQDKIQDLVDLGLKVFVGNIVEENFLNNIKISENIQIIYQLAGLHSSTEKMYQLYVEGTRNILELAKKHKTKNCIIASNISVYSDLGDEVAYEEAVVNPTHPFGIITKQMETVCKDYWSKHNVLSTILRIAQVYGRERDNLLIKMKSQKISVLGDGMNYNSWIHIEDLIDILVLALSKLQPREIYNVCDELSLKQVDLYKFLVKEYKLISPTWIPIHEVDKRIQISIHGLRALSINMSSQKLKKALYREFKYPSYFDGMKGEYKV